MGKQREQEQGLAARGPPDDAQGSCSSAFVDVPLDGEASPPSSHSPLQYPRDTDTDTAQ